LEEPRQRPAPTPHTPLALRAGFQERSHHADVLPRRPALRSGPDLPVRARPQSPTAHDLDLRPRNHRARMSTRLRVRRRPRRPRRDSHGRRLMSAARTPSQTIGPFFHDALLHSAKVPDQDGIERLLEPARSRLPRRSYLWVDAGYRGREQKGHKIGSYLVPSAPWPRALGYPQPMFSVVRRS
jgi:hypothetical protein